MKTPKPGSRAHHMQIMESFGGGGNLHYVSDMRFILAAGRPDIEQRMNDGTLTVQGALRELGRTTQRDRSRIKAANVQSLCKAVLRGNQEAAEDLAVKLLDNKFWKEARAKEAAGDCRRFNRRKV